MHQHVILTFVNVKFHEIVQILQKSQKFETTKKLELYMCDQNRLRVMKLTFKFVLFLFQNLQDHFS